jgi:hypothetical protein
MASRPSGARGKTTRPTARSRLDGGDDAISFDIPDQSPKSMSSRAWYLSVFVDPRFDDDGVHRRLFTFKDGPRIVLVGHTGIRVESSTGTLLKLFNISDPSLRLNKKVWSHLAFVLDYPNQRLKLYVNGYRKVSVVETALPPLACSTPPCMLSVGAGLQDTDPAFRGWIDEVKLLAYEPSFELACNHARGTLMQVTSNSGEWYTRAQAYPQTIHDNISDALPGGVSHGPQYACYYQWQSAYRANPREAQPSLELASIRERLTFPNGPLHYGQYRPSSTGNAFCLTCHHDAGKGGLNIQATLAAGTVEMWNDPRRQPMNPPRMMFGNVPAHLFGAYKPAQTQSTRDLAIDQYVFP